MGNRIKTGTYPMKIILSILLAIIFSIFFTFCSEEKKEETSENKIEEEVDVKEIEDGKVKSETPKEQVEIDYSKLDSLIRKKLIVLDSLYEKTPFYTIVDGDTLYYVVKEAEALFGIANSKDELILAQAYDKIFNPNSVEYGYIEIERDGKHGLFNFKNNKVIKPEFDLIYPKSSGDYIAIGKKGNNYFYITNDGIKKTLNNKDYPTLSIGGLKWNYIVQRETFIYNSYYKPFDEEGNGIVFTPGYINALNVLPKKFESVMKEGVNKEFGIIEANLKIVQEESITDKIAAFVSEFYNEIGDARGYTLNQRHIISSDKNGNIIDTKEMFSDEDYSSHYYCQFKSKLTSKENGLVEVLKYGSNKENKEYFGMPFYNYYKIENNGEIKNLKSNRIYDFTKYVEIDESYLKGCYSKFPNDDEDFIVIDEQGNEQRMNLKLNNHLTIEDLDIMRNEIFAEYGYIFKSEKWKNYFSEKSWYSPRHDNVDMLLTEIDKKNIKFILNIKNKMKDKEEDFLSTDYIMYGPPG